MSRDISRRDFLKLAISTAAAVGIGIGCFAAGFGIGGVTLRELFPKEKVVEKVVTKPGVLKLKIGFVYVGPIGDYGWTFGHDRGRKYVAKELKGIIKNGEPTYVESVYPEERVRDVIREFVEVEGCSVIFTTSFGYMTYTWEMAREYPDVLFGHCSGYLEPETPLNVCEYFIDLYEAYYLNGILAGAMTKTNKVGYVPAHLIPEVIRHINAFTIGVKEGAALVGKDPESVEVLVAPELGKWYAPDRARDAAEGLIAQGCDVLAYTEDSPTVLQVAEEHQLKGEAIWSFSHYSDMHTYGPHACLSGQLVNWGPLYEEMIIRAYIVQILHKLCKIPLEEVIKIWTMWPPERPRDYWWSMHHSHYIELSLEKAFREIKPNIYEPINVVDIWLINPKVPDKIRNYVLKRRKEIMLNKFDPFGPPIVVNGKVVIESIKDIKGKERILPGQRLSKDELYGMKWFVEGVRLLVSV